MKTLVTDGVSTYIFEDEELVDVLPDGVNAGSPVHLHIADCNSLNSVLYEGVSPPEDWFGRKYLFDGISWSLNPDWTEPEVLPQP